MKRHKRMKKNEKVKNHINVLSLPEDVLIEITNFFGSPKEIFNFTAVCKELFEIFHPNHRKYLGCDSIVFKPIVKELPEDFGLIYYTREIYFSMLMLQLVGEQKFLKYLKHFKPVRVVLEFVELSNEVLQSFSDVNALTISSNFKSEKFSDEAFKNFKSLKSMKLISVNGLSNGVFNTKCMSDLESLELESCKFSEKIFQNLKNLKTLKIIKCSEINIHEELFNINMMFKLERVAIRQCKPCSNEKSSLFMKGYYGLEFLEFTNSFGVSPLNLEHVRSTIKEIRILRSSFSEDNDLLWKVLKKLFKLRVLTIQDNLFSDQQIEELKRRSINVIVSPSSSFF